LHGILFNSRVIHCSPVISIMKSIRNSPLQTHCCCRLGFFSTKKDGPGMQQK
jgi:hypothetical protein